MRTQRSWHTTSAARQETAAADEGEVVKTTGDAVMVRYPAPDKAIL